MTIPGLATALLLMTGAQGAGAPAQEVVVSGSTVRLGDLFDLGALPSALQDRARDLVIIRLAPGQDRQEITARAVWARAGALMPALSHLPAPDSAARLSLRLAPQPIAWRGTCLRMTADVPQGRYLTGDGVAEATCDAPPKPALQYDARVGLVRAARDLNEGDLILAPPQDAIALIAPDQPIYLQTTVGVVTLQRQVTTVRPVRKDATAIVKAGDGSIIAVAAPEGRP